MDKMLGKKVLVTLLKGPRKSRDILMEFGGNMSVHSSLHRMSRQRGWVERKDGKCLLTPKGVTEAVRLDYDLKLRNSHPEQKVEVRPLVQVAADSLTRKMEDMRQEEATTKAIDWQTRHVEFLEEIVRNMTKGGG